MNNRCKLLVVVCAALTMATAGAEYPDRPIRFIVPSAPGGTPDVIARVVAAELSRKSAFAPDNGGELLVRLARARLLCASFPSTSSVFIANRNWARIQQEQTWVISIR